MDDIVREIVAVSGTVLLIGGSDTGKSTLAARLVNAGVDAGVRTGVIDADIGQSDIGPPGTVGLGISDRYVERLADVPVQAAVFVGNNSPESVLMDLVAGVRQLQDRALALGCRLIVIDTTGLVRGWTGRVLKRSKLNIVRPDCVVLLQREQELEHLVAGREEQGSKVFRLLPLPGVERKSLALRQQVRKQRYVQALAGARTVSICLDDVLLQRCFLGSGQVLDSRDLYGLTVDLDCDVVWAERVYEGLFVVVRGGYSRLVLDRLRRKIGADKLLVADEDNYRGLLLGVLNARGDLLGIGVGGRPDFRSRKWDIITAVAHDQIKILELGVLKIDESGQELGRVKRGTV